MKKKSDKKRKIKRNPIKNANKKPENRKKNPIHHQKYLHIVHLLQLVHMEYFMILNSLMDTFFVIVLISVFVNAYHIQKIWDAFGKLMVEILLNSHCTNAMIAQLKVILIFAKIVQFRSIMDTILLFVKMFRIKFAILIVNEVKFGLVKKNCWNFIYFRDGLSSIVCWWSDQQSANFESFFFWEISFGYFHGQK